MSFPIDRGQVRTEHRKARLNLVTVVPGTAALSRSERSLVRDIVRLWVKVVADKVLSGV